jgi:hypothetical protein
MKLHSAQLHFATDQLSRRVNLQTRWRTSARLASNLSRSPCSSSKCDLYLQAMASVEHLHLRALRAVRSSKAHLRWNSLTMPSTRILRIDCARGQRARRPQVEPALRRLLALVILHRPPGGGDRLQLVPHAHEDIPARAQPRLSGAQQRLFAPDLLADDGAARGGLRLRGPRPAADGPRTAAHSRAGCAP